MGKYKCLILNMKTILLNLSKKKQTLSFRFSVNISRRITSWYNKHQRQLPWRSSKDPYIIWVSEIIMQQTRIDQGTPYFERFMHAFPSVKHLANAPIDEVLLLWQGLGYYSRARNMHSTANYIMQKLAGKFPESYKELIKLKGVGPYTAAAISSICYGEIVPAIDGNAIRVITRIFDIDLPYDKAAGKKAIAELAASLIKDEVPGDFNQALMDFGSKICTPKNPDCNNCPVISHCLSQSKGTFAQRPVKSTKTKVRSRYFLYLYISDGYNAIIKKREHNDIWQGLYEFPVWEFETQPNLDSVIKSKVLESYSEGQPIELVDTFMARPHKLSHQIIHAQFLHARTKKLKAYQNAFVIPLKKLQKFAFPRLITLYIKNRIS